MMQCCKNVYMAWSNYEVTSKNLNKADCMPCKQIFLCVSVNTVANGVFVQVYGDSLNTDGWGLSI